jgi:hypothetical protein
MTSIVHGGAFNTTVLNPPNLNGFGAAANTKRLVAMLACA